MFTGRHHDVAAVKQRALDARYAHHRQRFVKGPPRVALPPARVEINPVTPEQIEAGADTVVNFPTLPRVAEAQRKSKLSFN